MIAWKNSDWKAGELDFNARQWRKFFAFSMRLSSSHSFVSLSGTYRITSLPINLPCRDTDNADSSRPEIQNAWNYSSTPPYFPMAYFKINLTNMSLYSEISSKLLLISEPASSVGIATGFGLDGPGIEAPWWRYFPHLSRPALGPTQPPVQWVPCLSRG